VETEPPAILEPPKMTPAPRREHGLTNFSLGAGAPAAPAETREVAYDLNVTYADGEIWNPATQKADKVRLRSYQGAQSALPRFIAPKIDVFPGQTVRITLHNNLPDDPTCRIKGGGSADTPNCFNGTNLHTHGLWVNPAGNGDNVLLSINPGVSFQYEYNIPPDHPAGTYWYHTHRHGSTALQVASGMAGALIVRGTRLPTLDANGDLDTLLKPTKNQPFPERTLVFQQIQYACRDSNGQIETNPDKTYKCDPGQVGGVEDYDQFGPGTWPASGRFTSINGAVLGHLDDAVAGRVERWRMIHGGVRDTITFQLRKLAPSAKAPANMTAANAPSYIKANCTGAAVPYHLVAADGLTLAAAQKVDEAVFQPGYRWDALVVFPEAGDYCVINDVGGASASVNQNEGAVQILGFVHVGANAGANVGAGETVTGDPSAYLARQLETAAEANMPAQVREKVVGELAAGIKLSSFTPHPDIKDGELTGKQTLAFNIDVSQLNEVFFEVDGQPYDPGRIDRTLMLGGADEWTLRSEFVSHPYHIHVNPFQIVKIIAPDGKTDVSAPGAIDNFAKDKNGKATVDPQYPGLKGVWKDTLFVKNIAPGGGPAGEYTVIVRTRYERYIGDFVLHCHILDHEDQGMMQNVRIALPDGKGGTVMEHH
jgi:FtsP/CotA-like multicopper oxidase with cupredoxin domain